MELYTQSRAGDAGRNDINGINMAMNVTVLALEGVFDTGLAIVLDALTTANELGAGQTKAGAPFAISVAGLRRSVSSAQGFGVPVRPAAACPRPDLVIVPALGYKQAGPLLEALKRADVVEAARALRAWRASGAQIAAACIGTFVLAESGMLDGHEATTTWWLNPLFRQLYPAVRLDTSRMLISSGPFLTAGAAFSHMDMMLWLIRQISPELAGLVARYLVVDQRPSQGAYIISDHLTHADPLVQRFDRWARDHLSEGFRLDVAAVALGASTRTLTRRVREVIGKTPLSHVRDLRIERAMHLLKTTGTSVDRIAESVGYVDGATLRTLLRQRLKMGIREIRRA